MSMSIEFLSTFSKIIIYGAGVKGKLVFQSLYALNISQKFLGFAVSDKKDIKDCYTKTIDEYRDYFTDALVIIAAKNNYQEEMTKKCEELGFINVIRGEELRLYEIYDKIYRPYHYEHFLLTLNNSRETRILDIGCGNNSIRRIRKYCNNVFYSGLDVEDYNLEEKSKQEINEYITVDSKQFANEILRWENREDAVISSHNIEHCEFPETVIVNMTKALKNGGRLYMAFPSEESVNFPRGYEGCLNFYDDHTHLKVPDWKLILQVLQENDMIIEFACKNYQPEIMRLMGENNLEKSKGIKKVLPGVWEYYGFESIIWARKKGR